MSQSGCQREKNPDGFWVCHHCGGMWTEEMMGALWRPLSCSDRKTAKPFEGYLGHVEKAPAH